LSVANFTSNDTVVAFSNYIGEGVLNLLGSAHMVGLVLLTVFLTLCYLAHLPLDASALLLFFAVIVLGIAGLLPAIVFFFALIITGLVVAWFLFKAVRM